MKTILKYSIGCDISKEKFDACISTIDTTQQVVVKATRKFNNTNSGINEVVVWIGKHIKQNVSITVTMEATGVYFERLAFALYEKDFYVSVVLPNKSKKYMESIGYKSKNDKIDAIGLARMGAEQNLKQWMPCSTHISQLRLLTRQNEDLQQQKTVLINRKEAQKFSQYENKLVRDQLDQMINIINQQIEQIKKEIVKVIEKDPILKEKVEKINTIKGLGILSIATIIAETNGFYLFKNQSQLVSYAGYDVVENESGKRKGKTRISKKGNSHIRRVLHMPAFNVVKYSQGTFSSLYERVYDRTKFKMKAYVAVQRRLLILIYTLWKNNEEFDPNYHKTSGNDELKSLFSLGFEKSVKKVAPEESEATQDELPCKESPEVLFSLLQK